MGADKTWDRHPVGRSTEEAMLLGLQSGNHCLLIYLSHLLNVTIQNSLIPFFVTEGNILHSCLRFFSILSIYLCMYLFILDL